MKMSEKKIINRQTIRSRRFLQQSLLDLIKQKPFQKITISDITENADLARSTFYAHFETKDELLESILDEILDQFFDHLYQRDIVNPNEETDLEINVKFFEIWKENAEIINLLKAIDIDCLLTKKLKEYWRKHNQKQIVPHFPEREHALGEYLHNYLAYSFVGILRNWVSEDMKHPSDVMGRLLYQLTGPPVLNEVYKNFNDEIN
jgi:AcrR family transcriptional regulator